MLEYQKQFMEFCIQNNVIKFGEFTLKSGRISPYFYDARSFNRGTTILQLGKFYAEAIKNSGIEFDVLFGPAYAGIPIVVSTAIALTSDHKIDKPFCFNRKVPKDYGESGKGGNLVGAPLKGKVLITEDVITAGITISETAEIIEENNAILAGICLSVNRQEKGKESEISAIQEIEQKYGIKVTSIITLQDIIDFVKDNSEFSKYLDKLNEYRKIYGVA